VHTIGAVTESHKNVVNLIVKRLKYMVSNIAFIGCPILPPYNITIAIVGCPILLTVQYCIHRVPHTILVIYFHRGSHTFTEFCSVH